MPDDLEFEGVRWSDRVAFSAIDGGFAYKPDVAYVRESVAESDLGNALPPGEHVVYSEVTVGGFREARSSGGPFDAVRAVAQWRAEGIAAQPNHVLFAHTDHCCCEPHPAALLAGIAGNPLHPHALALRAVHGNPLHPHAGAPSGVYGNPFHWNPLHWHAAGPSRSSARPAEPPSWFVPPPAGQRVRKSTKPPKGQLREAASPSVVIVDTGLASGRDLPAMLSAGAVSKSQYGTSNVDVPDANQDRWLDPVAGHGTFIAGIVERIAPGCNVEVMSVLTPQGDGTEADVVAAIDEVASRPNPPAFLNLSLGGYVWERAPMLSSAILRAQRNGIVVVASAGNDGTCRPSYPAAIPGVVSVGAVGPNGPAPFSNYGSWVRACAPGVDIVSSFFADFDGLEPPSAGRDIDHFRSWARWSGTSFAAPAVVGALVREMRRAGCTGQQAVANIIDAPTLGRIPGLGTVVNA
jgi:hypothetical protein